MLTLSVFSKLFLLPLLISILCSANQNINPCRRKWFPDAESFVCVCDDEFCDEPEPTGSPEEDELLLFSSDRQKHRLHRSSIRFSNTSRTEYDDAASASSSSALIIVNGSVQFQSLLGFGGAFSDSVGLNLNALNWSARERLLRAYFDLETGIGYRLGRVPIASTDFSTREYSYLDKERDFEMESFSLAPEDLELKIPYIQMANKMSGNRLQLFAAPWASPAWMKSNGRMSGAGQLKGDLDGPYYRTYAHYLKRFFDEYLANGIHFWALTLQNQPESGLEEIPFQSMFLSNHTQREFTTRLLVPLLRQSPHTAGLQLIAFDDVREHLVSSVREIFAKHSATPSKSLIGKFLCPLFAKMPASILPAFAFNFVSNLIGCRGAEFSPEGADLISGIGIHWYTLDGHEGQSEVHGMLPDKFILGTEACAGFLPEDAGPRLGNWTRGWMYGHDILQNLRNWAAGWVDWNLCLNERGGPNWANNFVDAPIIVSAEKGEFYKQPMFYWLAHFSRFIPPGSVHIQSSSFFNQEEEENPSIEHVAFVTPEGNKILVLINPPAAGAANLQRIRIRDAQSGREAELSVEAESIMTVIWK